MLSRYIVIRRVISLALLFFFCCGNTRISFGDRSAYAFSVGEEREVGEKLLSIVRREFKLVDDPDVAQYVTGLGGKILAAAGPQFFDYHFFVINNKELNAFAAPSGLVFLHSGLLELLSNENELVGVMAHECGHVMSRHIADRIKKSAKINIGTMAMVLAGMALGGGALSEALIAGSMAAGASMNLKFSRQDEEEADRLAFNLMQTMNRDPAAMLSTLRKIRKFNQFSTSPVPPYLLTHPVPAARMGYIQDLLLFGKKKQYKTIDEFDFKRIKCRVISKTRTASYLIPRYLQAINSGSDENIPETIMARYGLSLAYLAGAQFDEARNELRRVIAYYPHRPILKVDMGVIDFKAGRFATALRFFKEARQEAPDITYATYYLARTLQQTGKLEEALNLYQDLVAIMPDYPDLYYSLSKIKAVQGNNGVGYYYLGLYDWYRGDAKAAKLYLRRAVTILSAGDRIQKKAKDMLAGIERLEKVN